MKKISKYAIVSGIAALFSGFFFSGLAFAQEFNPNIYDGHMQHSIDPSLGIFFLIFNLLFLAVIIFTVVCVWKVFKKAGKPGWASIIPIYNQVVLLEIVDKPVWWIILLFIPFVNLIVTILVLSELSKKFAKGTGFTVGLFFLPFIFFPILAFGKAQYSGSTQTAQSAPVIK